MKNVFCYTKHSKMICGYIACGDENEHRKKTRSAKEKESKEEQTTENTGKKQSDSDADSGRDCDHRGGGGRVSPAVRTFSGERQPGSDGDRRGRLGGRSSFGCTASDGERVFQTWNRHGK